MIAPTTSLRGALALAFVLATATCGFAQDPPPATPPAAASQDPPPATPPAAASGAQEQTNPVDEEDLSFQRAQPDFNLVNLPTTLRLPRYKMAFRVTHRFTRPLGQGDFSDSLSDLFGLDSGAQIGLELRFAPIRGGQVGIHRTNDKTIEFFGQYNVWQGFESLPMAVAALASIEGTNNFQDIYSPGLGLSLSATIRETLALYITPMWVGNTNPEDADLVEDDNTAAVGFGARLRVRRGLYLVGEVWPRIAGYKGGDPVEHVHEGHDVGDGTVSVGEGKMLGAFGIEMQAGGHLFQINFSNAWATTPANIARGAAPGRTDWYLGFNISRKFF